MSFTANENKSARASEARVPAPPQPLVIPTGDYRAQYNRATREWLQVPVLERNPRSEFVIFTRRRGDGRLDSGRGPKEPG